MFVLYISGVNDVNVAWTRELAPEVIDHQQHQESSCVGVGGNQTSAPKSVRP